MSDMTNTLVKACMDVANQAAGWDSVPLLVPIIGPSKFWFTVKLPVRPLYSSFTDAVHLQNRHTKQKNFPTPRI